VDRDPEALADDEEDLPADLTEPVEVEAEVPEADSLDQHRAARPSARDAIRDLPPEVPEADALDQAREVPLDDDDRDE
jgi:hypothetical protein